MHLLARSQGVATLANAFRDKGFIQHEVEVMDEWLASRFPVADDAGEKVKNSGKNTPKSGKPGAAGRTASARRR